MIDGIANHQRALRDADFAQRYPQAQAWIVEDKGAAVGWLLLARQGDGLRVVDLAVAAHLRRRGVARTLLGALQDDPAGAGAITLRVRASNHAARALYASLGFTLQRDDGDTLELGWRRQAAA